jgi:hypothetical protein
VFGFILFITGITLEAINYHKCNAPIIDAIPTDGYGFSSPFYYSARQPVCYTVYPFKSYGIPIIILGIGIFVLAAVLTYYKRVDASGSWWLHRVPEGVFVCGVSECECVGLSVCMVCGVCVCSRT